MSFAGKLVYQIYHKPKASLKRLKKQGLLNSIVIIREQKNMRVQALLLKELHRPQLPSYDVYFLTGKKYWYQTAFCLYSLQKHCNSEQINGVFIDDGTITPELKQQIEHQFPHSKVILATDIEQHLDSCLPWDKYPVIRAKRLIYPHIKKLTDVHAGRNGWKMVLDSDMLFFSKPVALINWLQKPLKAFFLDDPISSYHYTLSLMEHLGGGEIYPNINVGAAGLNSETINWDNLEIWIKTLEEKEGLSYLLEQALTAILSATQTYTIASNTDYVVMPTKEEVLKPTAHLHHYVASSKEWYYKNAWKKI